MEWKSRECGVCEGGSFVAFFFIIKNGGVNVIIIAS